MGLKKGDIITPEDIINLKAKIKAELARRNGYGDISNFASSTYDFSTPPTVGGIITVEQGQKIVDLALKIKDIPNLKNVAKNDIIVALDIVNSSFDEYKNESMTGNSSSCRGACTGLCYGTCITGCNGCTGCTGCTGTCTGCNNTCAGTCSGCIGTCTGCQGCSSSCSSTCSSECGGNCTGSCISSCSMTCSTACWLSCTSASK